MLDKGGAGGAPAAAECSVPAAHSAGGPPTDYHPAGRGPQVEAAPGGPGGAAAGQQGQGG